MTLDNLINTQIDALVKEWLEENGYEWAAIDAEFEIDASPTIHVADEE